MNIRPMRSWIHDSRGKVLRQAQAGVPDGTAETLQETVRLVEAAGDLAEPVVSEATDESQTERGVTAATADTGRLAFVLKNNSYAGEFPLTQDYSADPRNLMIAIVVRGTVLSRGRHRGRAAVDRVPNLWLSGQGRHRRPAALHGPGKAAVSRVPS
ncbi:hypothetical protein [Streptomyces sp. NPDC001507]|uniref:hypothetical protein n=1 Tax=Streptomyces sp. NPDC001507 TaxID=3364579 RepID=UPI00367BA2E8